MSDKNLSPRREDYADARPGRSPIVVRVRRRSSPAELHAERLADLRERREARREDRGYRRDDRESNPIGVAGLATGVTALVSLLSSWLFARSLPGYLYLVAGLSVLAAPTGLALSVVGALLRGRPKGVALAGIAVGMPLLSFVLPMSFRLPALLK